jgi:hypothetical protein
MVCVLPGARAESEKPAPAAPAPAAAPDGGGDSGTKPTEGDAPKPAPSSPLKIGAELYTGGSNMPGHHFLDAGVWAGSGLEYPSVGYVRWEDGKGHAAKAALGFGTVFYGKDKIYDQPAEAWYQFPAGKASVTVGQYWVPFATQEWEYENKPGAMAQWSHGRWGVSLSANQNFHTGHPNAYARLSHTLGGSKDNLIGLSVGGGKGMSYNSGHNRGLGVDGTYGYGGVRFTTELLWLRAPGARDFRFIWTKLGYEKLGPWKPYVSWYHWDDQTHQLGHFQSTLLGLSYKVNANLAIEGAVADTLRKNVGWMQLHWTWER